MITPVISTIGTQVAQLSEQIKNPWFQKKIHEIRKRVQRRQAVVNEQVDHLRGRAEQFRQHAEVAGKEALKAAVGTRDRVMSEVNGLRGASPTEIKTKAKSFIVVLNNEFGHYSKIFKESFSSFLGAEKPAHKKKSSGKKKKAAKKHDA